LSARGIPLLTIDCVSKGLDHIGVDRAAGTARMVRLFLLSGAKSPLFLSSTPFEAWNSDDRLVGIRRGLESLGLELRPEMIVALAPGLMGPAAGYEAASRILKSMFADAIFCYSDACAIGVMRALLRAEVRIPRRQDSGLRQRALRRVPARLLEHRAQPSKAGRLRLGSSQTRREDFSMPPRAMNMESTLVIRESAPITDHALREQIFKPL
jgi:DNA-binding LacI/PurR family transcriptional regulator